MARSVRDHDRQFGRDGVEVGFVEESRLSRLCVVELETLYPVPAICICDAFPEDRLDVGDASLIAVRRHDMPRARAQNVYVGVDQAGNDCLAPHVPDRRAWPDQTFDVVVAPDADEEAATDGQRLRARQGRVHGHDVGAFENGVGE